MEEKIGTAIFIGKHDEMPTGIDRFEEYPLYESDSFYIRDPKGNQIIMNDDWRMTIEGGVLHGKNIDQVIVNYESVVVCSKYGNHRITLPDLTRILRKYDYDIEKKRTRTYITRRSKK